MWELVKFLAIKTMAVRPFNTVKWIKRTIVDLNKSIKAKHLCIRNQNWNPNRSKSTNQWMSFWKPLTGKWKQTKCLSNAIHLFEMQVTWMWTMCIRFPTQVEIQITWNGCDTHISIVVVPFRFTINSPINGKQAIVLKLTWWSFFFCLMTELVTFDSFQKQNPLHRKEYTNNLDS